MATIPIFAPTADYQVGGLQGFTAPTAEPMKDATGAQIAQRGDALGKIGTTAIVMASRMELEAQRTQDVLDETEVAHAINGFSSFAGKNLYGDKGFMMAKGMDANPDALNGATMTLTEERDRLRTGLSTSHGQKLFDLKSEGMMSTLGTEMTKHASVETKLAHTAEGLASVSSQLQVAMGGDGVVGGVNEWKESNSATNAMSMAAFANAKTLYMGAGDSEKVADGKVLDIKTKFFTAGVYHFLALGTQGGAEQALAYLTVHKSEINQEALPQLEDRVRKTLEVAEVSVVGNRTMNAALDYMLQHKGGEADGYNFIKTEYDEGRITIKEFDNAMARFKTHNADAQQMIQRQEKMALNKIEKYIVEHPGITFEKLPHDMVQENFMYIPQIKHLINNMHRQESDPKILDDLIQEYIHHPLKFGERKLLLVRGDLNQADYAHMQSLQISAGKGEAKALDIVNEIKSTEEIMKGDFALKGIDITPKPGTSQERQFGMIYNGLLKVYEQRNAAGLPPATSAEKRAIGNSVLRDTLTKEGGVLGFFQKTVPVYEALDPKHQVPATVAQDITNQLKMTMTNWYTLSDLQQKQLVKAVYDQGVLRGKY